MVLRWCNFTEIVDSLAESMQLVMDRTARWLVRLSRGEDKAIAVSQLPQHLDGISLHTTHGEYAWKNQYDRSIISGVCLIEVCKVALRRLLTDGASLLSRRESLPGRHAVGAKQVHKIGFRA